MMNYFMYFNTLDTLQSCIINQYLYDLNTNNCTEGFVGTMAASLTLQYVLIFAVSYWFIDIYMLSSTAFSSCLMYFICR